MPFWLLCSKRLFRNLRLRMFRSLLLGSWRHCSKWIPDSLTALWLDLFNIWTRSCQDGGYCAGYIAAEGVIAFTKVWSAACFASAFPCCDWQIMGLNWLMVFYWSIKLDWLSLIHWPSLTITNRPEQESLILILRSNTKLCHKSSVEVCRLNWPFFRIVQD